jgi:hypothetical protein
MKRYGLLGFFAVLLVAQATAQNEPDPLYDENAGIDDGKVPMGRFYGDLLLRYDHIGSLNPLSGTQRIERERARLRVGWRASHESVEYAIAAKIARGSDSNKETRANLDNERTDMQGLDELMLRWTINDSSRLLLGKTALPLDLSPMLWDADLRPAGISISKDFAVGDFDRVSLVGGLFAPQHLYEDDSTLGAVQLGYHWREGAPFSGAVRLGYLHFDDLDQMTTQGLTRSNWRHIIRAPGAPPPQSCGVCHGVSGALVNDFRLLDLQGELRWMLDDKPLVAKVDLVKNLGADQDNEGARVSLDYGDASVPHGWEAGIAYQRFQRDAVLAAFSDDDWWFHSNARGLLTRIAYGIDETWSVQLTYVRDRRDGPFRNGPVERTLLDVRANW